MKFPYIPYYYRRIRSIGMAREWYATQADRRAWSNENYPPPPNMGHPGVTLLSGSWSDIRICYRKFNRYSRTRGTIIESKKKLKRLIKRREARKYRVKH